MSWEIISTNTAGYKKWKDSYGNHRYQKPNGQFTSPQAWSGSFSQEGVEKDLPNVDVETGGYSGDTLDVKTEEPRVKVRDDLASYQMATDVIFDEPWDWPGLPPIDWPPIKGIPVEEYPVQERIDLLGETMQEYSAYDHYSYAIRYVVYDNNSVVNRSEKHTTMQPAEDRVLLEGNFQELVNEISMISAYDGVVIQETVLKCREYQEQYK